MILFFSIIFSVNIGIDFFRGGHGHTYTRLKEIKSKNNIDILFCGSSHAYRGFNTNIFRDSGYTVFNLGSSSQTHIQTEILLKRYLTQVKPKLVIYEVNPEIFTMKGVESAIDIISNDKNDFESIKMVFKIQSLMAFNTLNYTFLYDIINRNKAFSENKQKDEDTYIEGGYVEKKLTNNKTLNISQNKFKIDINKKQIQSFENALSLISKTNCKVILVFAPITSRTYNTFENLELFSKMMSTYGKYYDFNKIIILNDTTDFYDSEHLNINGVLKFNNKLIQVIKYNYYCN